MDYRPNDKDWVQASLDYFNRKLSEHQTKLDPEELNRQFDLATERAMAHTAWDLWGRNSYCACCHHLPQTNPRKNSSRASRKTSTIGRTSLL